MEKTGKRSAYREKRKKRQNPVCACCKEIFLFCWQCRCGFCICKTCMDANFWGMSCNGITWQCPDCGGWNGFGNQ